MLVDTIISFIQVQNGASSASIAKELAMDIDSIKTIMKHLVTANKAQAIDFGGQCCSDKKGCGSCTAITEEFYFCH